MELIVHFLVALAVILFTAIAGWLYAKLLRRIRPGPRTGVPYQAPRPLAEFVGRRGEIERLTEALEPGGKTAITGVVGMGGIGKTELAKIVADQVARRYRDGILWADCGQERLAGMADRWAGAYGVEKLPGEDFQTKAASWRGLISGKEALLIFDNVQPGQEIEPLFPPPGSRSMVLITTRHEDHPALRDIEPLRLDQFTKAEAMALAEEVLGRREARRQREDAEHLFELVGYLPLAVNIALHLAEENGWELKELNQKLEKAGAIKALDTPGLHKSLRATFQTAWDNLPDDLQRAFASLAVFNQGPSFDTWAMAAVMEIEEPDVRALLNHLAGRSLLTKVGEQRWSLHPLLREFAAEKLPADDRAWARMAAHYVEVAAAADELYKRGGEDLLHGLALFDLEWPHIRAGHAWAVEQADTDEEATRRCSEYPDAGALCLALRLHPQARIAWLEAAADVARKLGDREAEGAHLGNLGNAYLALGEARKAIEFHQKALEIRQAIGDRRGEENHLGNLGLAYAYLGKVRKAIEFHQKALEIARGIEDRRSEGDDLGNLGLAYYRLGEVRKAIEFHKQALEIDGEIGNRQGEGDDLGNLGLAYAALGQVRKAIRYYEKALEIRQEIGDRRGEENDLGNVGVAYHHLGEYQKAIEYYHKALEIAKDIGDRRGEVNGFGNLGTAYHHLGEYRKAIEYYQSTLEIAKDIGDRLAEGSSLGNLGNAYADLGEVREAIGYYEEALEIAREIGDRRGEGRHRANMGQAYKQLGDVDRARELWEEALRIYEEIEDPHAEWVRRWLEELEK